MMFLESTFYLDAVYVSMFCGAIFSILHVCQMSSGR